jgi:hypothetical protein
LFAERARLRGRPGDSMHWVLVSAGGDETGVLSKSLCAYTAGHLVTRREILDVVAFRN